MKSVTSKDETLKLISHTRQYTEDVIKQGPEACKAFLFKMEVLNEDGSLTEMYGGDPKQCIDSFCAFNDKLSRCKKTKTHYDKCLHKKKEI